MSFIGVLEAIGKDFARGLQWAVQYGIPVEKLVGLLFPSAAPATTALADATVLIQNAVVLVEQKYAASGAQSGTGPAKLAEVMALAAEAVASLLAKANITASNDYIASLVSAVVALLNVQPAPAAIGTTK